MSCFFCHYLETSLQHSIYQDELCFVIEDEFPVSPGHLLIISKKHYKHWFVAPEPLQQHLIVVVDKMKKYLDKAYGSCDYNFGFNCGEAAGQTISHLHLHLIPRYKGDVRNPKGGVRGVIPSKQHYHSRL